MDARHSLGFSLIELLTTLCVLAIALQIATPSFLQMIQRSERVEATRQLLSLVNHARGTAIHSRHNAVLCAGVDSCAASQSWQQELLVFEDLNGNGQLDANEPIRHQEPLKDGLTWYWSNFRSRDYLMFEPNGTTHALNGTFRLCRQGQVIQQVTLNLAGRAYLREPDTDASCP